MDTPITERKPTEEELAARAVAPRVTQADVDAAVLTVQYHVFPGTTLTVCCLTMQNGFQVTGESAAADPANFQKDIGERFALQGAKSKIWQFLGYALRDKLHNTARGI